VEVLESRIENLEIRLTFQDDLVRQLDEVVQAQNARIDQLMQEIHSLREQLAQNPGEEASMQEQVPPHW
jgi:SlyX protein